MKTKRILILSLIHISVFLFHFAFPLSISSITPAGHVFAQRPHPTNRALSLIHISTAMS